MLSTSMNLGLSSNTLHLRLFQLIRTAKDTLTLRLACRNRLTLKVEVEIWQITGRPPEIPTLLCTIRIFRVIVALTNSFGKTWQVDMNNDFTRPGRQIWLWIGDHDDHGSLANTPGAWASVSVLAYSNGKFMNWCHDVPNLYPKMVAFKERIRMAKEHLEKVIFCTHGHAAAPAIAASATGGWARWPIAPVLKRWDHVKSDLELIGWLGSATKNDFTSSTSLVHLLSRHWSVGQRKLWSMSTHFCKQNSHRHFRLSYSRAWTATTQSTQALLQFASLQCLQNTGFFFILNQNSSTVCMELCAAKPGMCLHMQLHQHRAS